MPDNKTKFVYHGPLGVDETNNVFGVPHVSGHAKAPTAFPAPPVSGSGGSGGGSHGGSSDSGGSGGGFLTIPGFEQVGKVLHYLTDKVFWERVGIGVLGWWIILASLILIITASKPGQAAVKGLKTAGGTAAGAAVGGPVGAAAGGTVGSQL